MPQRKPNSFALKEFNCFDKIPVLLGSKRRTVFAVIRNSEMSKDTLCLQAWQFTDSQCIAQLRMTAAVLKTDSAHSAVNFNVHFHTDAVRHRRLRQRVGL